MRLCFAAHITHVPVAPGTFVKIFAEPHRLGDPPPDMPAGSDLTLGQRGCEVLWAERDRAIVEIAGQTWLMSHLRPSEIATYRDSYPQGHGVAFWVVRERVDAIDAWIDRRSDPGPTSGEVEPTPAASKRKRKAA